MKRETTVRLLNHLPAETLQLLERYVALLDRWRQITNLVSERSFAEVWHRHIEDCIRVQRACPGARRWLDIGSGAGFPGIVIAIVLSKQEGASIHCVESDSRKCAFLRTVASELSLPAKVHNLRAEALSPGMIGPIDAVTARAFSSTNRILQISQDFLAMGAVAVLPRGKTWTEEVVAVDSDRYTISETAYPHVILVTQKKLCNP